MRMLRSTGTSFSYVSGRSQSDDGLPWFGLGREYRDFEEDKQALSMSLRRTSLSSPRSRVVRASSPTVAHRHAPSMGTESLPRSLSFDASARRMGRGESTAIRSPRLDATAERRSYRTPSPSSAGRRHWPPNSSSPGSDSAIGTKRWSPVPSSINAGTATPVHFL